MGEGDETGEGAEGGLRGRKTRKVLPLTKAGTKSDQNIGEYWGLAVSIRNLLELRYNDIRGK